MTIGDIQDVHGEKTTGPKKIASSLKKTERIWRVTMMHGSNETHIADIPTTHITEDRLKALMQTVYAKHCLNVEETVCFFLKGTVKKHFDRMKIEPYNSRVPISYLIAGGSSWVYAIVAHQGRYAPCYR